MRLPDYRQILLLIASVLYSCSDDSDPNPQETTLPEDSVQTDTDFGLGLTGEEDFSEVPSSPLFGVTSADNLPSAVDLSEHFPPIGSQGNYGTCVTWAVSYNALTAAFGVQNGLSASELQSREYQFSPMDLFIAIPDFEKGTDCNGTDFIAPLDVLQQRGNATWSTVPYEEMSGDCRQANLQTHWTEEAGGYKIDYWRKINPDVTSIKQQIASGNPVIFGAKLDDEFMSWDNNEVYSSHTTFDRVGIHAYHAMIISGYDDNKDLGAFEIVNSWGDGWGSDGKIWVDYQFFMDEFVMGESSSNDVRLFTITVSASEDAPPNDDDDEPIETEGIDLVAWVYEDAMDPDGFIENQRTLTYGIYNDGIVDATPNLDWTVMYLYYNAYDANDYDFLFIDVWSDEYGESGPDPDNPSIYILNETLESGGAFEVLDWKYVIPPELNGDYYLILLADAYDDISEADEYNNVFYTTEYPITFENGVASRTAADTGLADFINDKEYKEISSGEERLFRSAVKPAFRNAYTQEEIRRLIKSEKASGRLDEKIRHHLTKKRLNNYKSLR